MTESVVTTTTGAGSVLSNEDHICRNAGNRPLKVYAPNGEMIEILPGEIAEYGPPVNPKLTKIIRRESR